MIPFLAPMAGFLNPVGNFLKRIPDWVIWIVLAVVFLKFVDMNAEHRGRQREKDKRKTRDAEIKVAVTERQSEIRTEEQTNADEALRARDAGAVFPDAASVPDEIADVLFRGSRRGQ